MKKQSNKRFALIAILAVALSVLFVFTACEPTPDPNPEVESITVDATGVQKTFYVGDEFNSVGLKVVVNYDDGSKSTITSGFNVSAPNMTQTGEKDVVVTYCEKQDSYKINVLPTEDKPQEYEVEFNLDGGSGDITGVKSSYPEGADFKLPSASGLSKEGHAFDCWNDGEKDYAEGADYSMPAHKVTFTAKWTKVHECESACDVCHKCTDTECEEEVCKDKCPLHYTVSFVLDEDVQGTITGFEDKFDTNATFDLPSASGLRREGYVFVCWNDGENDYQVGDSYTVTKDVTFTAKWTNSWDKLYGKTSAHYDDGSAQTSDYVDGKTYAFNPARGEFIYEAEDASRGSGLSLEARPNASGGNVLNGFSNDKRTFTIVVYSTCDYTAMLSISVTGQTGLGASQKASYYFTVKNNTNNSTVDCSDTDLIAGNWGANPVLYAENLIGEISLVAGKNTIEVNVEHAEFGTNECIQIDYLLLSPRVYDVTGDEPARRSISFDLDGANGTMEAIECYEDQIVTIPDLGGRTREGYLFDGYLDESNHLFPGDVIIVGKGNIVLVAQWRKDNRIEWQESYGNPDKSTYVDGSKNAFVPSRGVYIYEAEDAILGTGLTVESDKVNASGNKQLGGFTTAKRTVTFEVYSLYAYTALISLGYTTSPSFSTTLFADHFVTITHNGNAVNCANTMLTPGNWSDDTYVESYLGEVNLVAGLNTIVFEFVNLSDPNNLCLDYMLVMPKTADVTEQTKHTLAYDVNEAEGSVQGGEYYEGEYVSVAYATGISKLGHYFAGWSYDEETYSGGAKFIMPASDVTLTAIWEQSEAHAVRYNLDGGEGDLDTEAMAGSQFFLPEDVTRDGYTFGGWAYNGKRYSGGASFTMPDEDVTFDAIWIAGSDKWDDIFGAADPEKNYTKTENCDDVNKDNVEHEFAYDPSNGTHIYEAEASYHPGLRVEGENGNGDSKPNASGRHQLAGFDTNSFTFSFKINASKAGLALLTIAYTGNPETNRDNPASYYMQIVNGDFVLNCDDVTLLEANWAGDGYYVELRLGMVYLNEGINTLTFTFENWTWPNAIAMDYILLTPEIEDAAAEDDQLDTSSAAQEAALVPELVSKEEI